MPVIIISLVFFSFSCAKTQSYTPDHRIWTKELKKYVSTEGIVNYAAWKKDAGGLDQYLLQLSKNPVQEGWSGNEKLAYWINAYNAFTIKIILDHYPVKSIREINNGNPWDKAWIKLGEETYSLNQIETKIIRSQFNEPRIHFALNCGSVSCPPVPNEAFDPSNLESQLSACTRKFIHNKKYNLISPEAIRVSQIFNWYKEDFKPDLISFLNQYLLNKVDLKLKIEYLPYDWALNEREP